MIATQYVHLNFLCIDVYTFVALNYYGSVGTTEKGISYKKLVILIVRITWMNWNVMVTDGRFIAKACNDDWEIHYGDKLITVS